MPFPTAKKPTKNAAQAKFLQDMTLPPEGNTEAGMPVDETTPEGVDEMTATDTVAMPIDLSTPNITTEALEAELQRRKMGKTSAMPPQETTGGEPSPLL